ncbi:MAG: bifunctional folylpolyglutamate synthase/dihydrofolate synthase [Phycisphaeraceae bacterium]|nr:bifunctional folylpolyglutamate synthase/dihydrofolate synthase [Phycisphaeraceae bacterium]MCB9848871.1 bifunctional folylpolyglutamate synthase/dihydrofolate synthase [Phycisphaeraceae bacterium]
MPKPRAGASGRSRAGGRSVSKKKTARKTASKGGSGTKSGSAGAPAGKGRTKAPKRFASYQSALRHLYDRVDFERARVRRLSRDDLKLERMRALLKKLGDPQLKVPTTHVVGTNGKGSTCHLLSTALRSCGYTVGLYTSPHLQDVRERIEINGQPISTADFTRLMATVARAAASVERAHGVPTFFEMMTALALTHFADEALDVAVIECGLGGRLDATSCIQPSVVAVTSISIDHTQLLGETAAEIAAEKAGAFKPGVPVVTIPQSEEVMAVLRAESERIGSPLSVLGEDIEFSSRFEASPKIGTHTCICLSTERSEFEHLTVPLLGEHQALNCGLALAALDVLRSQGFDTPEMKVINGLAGLSIPGRMELAWERPRVLLDGAHNAESLKALIRSIGAHIPYDSMVLIFGCGEDKDVDELLRTVALGADKIIFTRARKSPRAMDPDDLRRRFVEVSANKMCQVAGSFDEALDLAERAVGPGDLICVTGSFHLVGEAKRCLADRTKPAATAEG